MPKLPKDAKDWHPDLVKAAHARYVYAHYHNKRNQNIWKDTWNSLDESQNPIYIQKGGQKKGQIIGLPNKIKNDAIRQELLRIVNEEDPVLRPEHEGLTNGNVELNIVETKFFRDRKYRDSAYSILAAMYSDTSRMPTIFYETQITKNMSKFTDLPINFDYRSGQQGAWKAMDSLRNPHAFVHRDSSNRPYTYNLTQEGLRFCYALFNKKFHPSQGPYVLVQPQGCQVTEEGLVITTIAPRGGFMETTPAPRISYQPLVGNMTLEAGRRLSLASLGNLKGFEEIDENLNTINHQMLPMSRVGYSQPYSEVNQHLNCEEVRNARLMRFEANRPELKKDSTNDVDEDEENLETALTLSLLQSSSVSTTSTNRPYQYSNEDDIDIGRYSTDLDLDVALAISAQEVESSSNKTHHCNTEDEDNLLLETALAISASEIEQKENDINTSEAIPLFDEQIEIIDITTSTTTNKTTTTTTAVTPSKKKKAISQQAQPPIQSGKISRRLAPPTNREIIVDDITTADDKNNYMLIDLTSTTSTSTTATITISENELGPTTTCTHSKKLIFPPCMTNLQLLVDNFERKENSSYRQFFNKIRETIKKSTSKCDVYDVHLKLGDFMWVYVTDDDTNESDAVLTDFIIERKCLSDLISRSAGLNAPHIKQERKLRFCGLKHPFFLIEGDHRYSDNMRGPRVWSEDDLTGPDIMANTQDFITFLCNIICRNFGNHIVQIIQTENDIHTAYFLSALTVYQCQDKAINNSMNSNGNNSTVPRNHATFNSYVTSGGARKIGREGNMRSQLRSEGVHPEFIERIWRRFGDANNLKSTYDHCNSEIHKKLLLSELGIGGTNIDCDSLVQIKESSDLSSNDSNEEKTLSAKDLTFQSQLVWSIISDQNKENQKQLSSYQYIRVAPKSTMVRLSPQLSTLLNGLDGFHDNICAEIISSSSSLHLNRHHHHDARWGSMQSRSMTASLHTRCSETLSFIVVDAIDLVEALVLAVDQNSEIIGKESAEYTFASIAVQTLLDGLPKEFIEIHPKHKHKHTVMIIEGLFNASHGAIDKLKGSLSRAKFPAPGGASQQSCGEGGCSSSFSLAIGRVSLPISAAQIVESQSLLLIYLCVAILSLDGNIQCIHSSNAKQSYAYLCCIINTYHRESLLIL